MKKVRVLLAVLFILSAAGCIFDGGNDGDNGNKGEYLDSYFPMNTRMVKDYVITSYFDANNVLSMMTRYCTGTTMIEGKEYYVFRTKGTNDILYYRVENDIVLRYYPENEKTYAPQSHEEPLLDFTKSPGESWPVVSTVFSDGVDELIYSITAVYIGTETVEVLAGTFEECSRFDNYEKWEYVSSSGDSTKTQSTEMKYKSWYAKKIGMVKIEAEGEFFGDHKIELYKYTE